jgi:hypothetical protein
MHKVMLDKEGRLTLDDTKNKVEVCDEAGQTVGYFLPAESYRRLVYDWAKAQVTEAELDAARREPGGSPLAEFLAELEQACATPSPGGGRPSIS